MVAWRTSGGSLGVEGVGARVLKRRKTRREDIGRVLWRKVLARSWGGRRALVLTVASGWDGVKRA